MIKIIIAINNGKLVEELDDTDCNISEVAFALLRLKQIERILIDKDFEDILKFDGDFEE